MSPLTFNYSEALGGPDPAIEAELKFRAMGGLPDADEFSSTVFVAEKIAAGTATVDTVYGPLTLDEVETYAGAGSPLHCMVAAYLAHRTNDAGPAKGGVYICCSPEDAGGVIGSQTLTFATNASGAGEWVFAVGGHHVRVSVADDDTPTEQAAEFVRVYDALEWGSQKPPITVTSAAGVVTLVTTTKSDHLANIGLETVTDPGITTTATWSGDSMGNAVGGTAPDGEPSFTNTTPAILGFADAANICVPFNADADIETLVDLVNTRANAQNMIPSYLVWAVNDDTVSNMETAVTGVDSDDAHRVLSNCLEGTETWGGEFAARVAAVVSSETNLARSYDGLEIDVDVPSTSDRFTRSDRVSLLNCGATPWYQHTGSQKVGCCRAVMTRTEFGVVDFANVRVADYVRKAAVTLYTQRLRRMNIIADGEPIPPRDSITTPAGVKSMLRSVLNACRDLGYLQRVEELWERFADAYAAGTLEQIQPIDMIDQLHNVIVRFDVLV